MLDHLGRIHPFSKKPIVGEVCSGHHDSYKMSCTNVYIYTYKYIQVYTLPETNIAPENGWLEY